MRGAFGDGSIVHGATMKNDSSLMIESEMSFKINATELRNALKEIELAEKNGFMYCLAIFEPQKLDGIWVQLRYSDLHEKAHPTDGKLDWGRCQSVSYYNKFKGGKLIPIKK